MDHPDVFDLLNDPGRYLNDTQQSWLQPPGRFRTILGRILYEANRATMRSVFRLQANGIEHLPAKGPFILAPTHASTLDPFALAAALPRSVIKQTYWAGRNGAVLRNPWRRSVNRLAGVIPMARDITALAVGAAVLRAGKNLVWFPEGTRTTTGELQDFRPGIGMLMKFFEVPAIPVLLENTFENMPPSARWPQRVQPISVCFGEPVHTLDEADDPVARPEEAAAIADQVRDEVVKLDEEICQ